MTKELPAVVYMSRWHNRRWAPAFLRTIAAHSAGMKYDLILVLKGYPQDHSSGGLKSFENNDCRRVETFRISDEGYDLNAYLKAAAHFEHRAMLFLNSYSGILAKNWLVSYSAALASTTNCGIVGATGSFETIPGMEFPNINVRSNAFMIDRKLFLSLDAGPLATKGDCQQFEAGAKSMTRQVVQRGLEPVLVDRAGKMWHAPDWPKSRTFRSGQQEGLLVADNRTQHYQVGSAAKRLKLARLAWGENAVVPRISWAGRIRAEVGWRWPRIGGQTDV